MRGPDYIIVGAMKCGTSTLAAQLGAQDGIFMTTPKEPNYFSDDAVYARGADWYAALFDAAAPGDLLGEASTHYTKLPTHPRTLERLRADLPDLAPRLIYLIRDPLARAVSHHIHEWTQGVVGPDISEALTTHPEIAAYGEYARQIAPWVEAYGAEAVLVLTLEGMQADPQGTMDRVAAHLGRPGLVWRDDLERMNVSAERIRRLPLQGLILDNPVATWLRRTLVPQSFRDRVKAARRMPERPALSEADRARLVALYTADRARLMQMFPNRPDLDLAYPFVPHG